MGHKGKQIKGVVVVLVVLLIFSSVPVLAFLYQTSGSNATTNATTDVGSPIMITPTSIDSNDTANCTQALNETADDVADVEASNVVVNESDQSPPLNQTEEENRVIETVSVQQPVTKAKAKAPSSGWKARYTLYPEFTELREHSVKHFDLGNGNRVAIVSGGLLHYYDGEKYEEIPALPFPEGLVMDTQSNTHVLTFPDWCTVRVDEDGAVVRAYDAKGAEVYTFMHPFVVAKGVSAYKPANTHADSADIAMRDDEPEGGLNILDEDAVTYCTFAVEGNNLHLVPPEHITYPVQAYDDTASGTNTKDSDLRETYPDSNYGSGELLQVDARLNSIIRTVMGWTMPDGTGTITGVNLSLYKYDNYGSSDYNVEVHEILETGFVESNVTWNNRTSSDEWNASGCSPPSSNTTVVDSVPRTTSENEWHTWWLLGDDAENPMNLTWNDEFEILLRESETVESSRPSYERFYSKEYSNPDYRPYLIITYEPDTDPPEWSDPQTNRTLIHQNDTVRFTANWMDNWGLAGAVFAINQSGSWVNSSYVPFSGTANISENITVITAAPGSTVQWRFYANDTADNWNATAVQSFIVRSAEVPSTPFVICGRVYYKNGSACTNPRVNVTNLNTSETWQAETNQSYNYYQLILANGTDVHAGDVLRFVARDPQGLQVAVVEHGITGAEVTTSGLFNLNITLESPVTPFIIYGWVLYESGSPCNNPTVKITNTNTSRSWLAEIHSGSHFYQLILDTANVSAQNVLAVNATDGTRFNHTNHSVTQSEFENGGLFSFNLTLPTPPAAPIVECITITPDDDGYSEGVQIAPNPGASKTVTVSAVVSDSNGYEDILTVAVTINGPSTVPESPITLSLVSHSTPTTATYNGTFNLSFYNLSGMYTVNVTATDSSSQNGSKDAPFEYQTARALEFDTGTINFGAIDPGSTSEVLGDEDMGTLSNATVRNIGNVVFDIEVSGTNMTANGNTITRENIEARLDNLSYLNLSVTRTFATNLPAGSLSLENADFKLLVPVGTPDGTYSGGITISAAAP